MSELEEFEEEFAPRSKNKPFTEKLLCGHRRKAVVGRAETRACMSLATVTVGSERYCAFHAKQH